MTCGDDMYGDGKDLLWIAFNNDNEQYSAEYELWISGWLPVEDYHTDSVQLD